MTRNWTTVSKKQSSIFCQGSLTRSSNTSIITLTNISGRTSCGSLVHTRMSGSARIFLLHLADDWWCPLGWREGPSHWINSLPTTKSTISYYMKVLDCPQEFRRDQINTSPILGDDRKLPHKSPEDFAAVFRCWLVEARMLQKYAERPTNFCLNSSTFVLTSFVLPTPASCTISQMP